MGHDDRSPLRIEFHCANNATLIPTQLMVIYVYHRHPSHADDDCISSLIKQAHAASGYADQAGSKYAAHTTPSSFKFLVRLCQKGWGRERCATHLHDKSSSQYACHIHLIISLCICELSSRPILLFPKRFKPSLSSFDDHVLPWQVVSSKYPTTVREILETYLIKCGDKAGTRLNFLGVLPKPTKLRLFQQLENLRTFP